MVQNTFRNSKWKHLKWPQKRWHPYRGRGPGRGCSRGERCPPCPAHPSGASAPVFSSHTGGSGPGRPLHVLAEVFPKLNRFPIWRPLGWLTFLRQLLLWRQGKHLRFNFYLHRIWCIINGNGFSREALSFSSKCNIRGSGLPFQVWESTFLLTTSPLLIKKFLFLKIPLAIQSFFMWSLLPLFIYLTHIFKDLQCYCIINRHPGGSTASVGLTLPQGCFIKLEKQQHMTFSTSVSLAAARPEFVPRPTG